MDPTHIPGPASYPEPLLIASMQDLGYDAEQIGTLIGHMSRRLERGHPPADS